jgi:tRNA A-37 threonylcarbamoyl transferase component Bud32
VRGIDSIRAALPIELSSGTTTRWFLSDRCWTVAASAVDAHLEGVVGNFTIEQLKTAANRDIFRCSIIDSAVRVIAKTFPMRTLKQKLCRYKRYGPSEARNLIAARKRGLPVPAICGFGWEKRGLLVKRTMVLMEDLQGFSPLSVIENVNSEDAKMMMLRPVADALVSLYVAGCNHIDLGAENIFVSDAAPMDVRLIDFMYAAFLPAPSTTVLAFQAAYVSDSLRYRGVAESTCRQWAVDLFSRNEVDAEVEGLVEKYDNFRGSRLSRKERLALG